VFLNKYWVCAYLQVDVTTLDIIINFPLDLIECIQYQCVVRRETWFKSLYLNSWMWAHCSCAECSACCCCYWTVMNGAIKPARRVSGWLVCLSVDSYGSTSVGDSFCYASCWLSEKRRLAFVDGGLLHPVPSSGAHVTGCVATVMGRVFVCSR